MNPFISFCLYVAARVFVQYLKSRPDDSQTADSLRFLLSAMNALKKKNPLTESFLVQLDVDLEGLGMRNPKYKSAFAFDDDNVSPYKAKDSPLHPDHMQLGISSAKAPNIGQTPRNGPPGYRNECNFMRISEEVPLADASSGVRHSSDLAATDPSSANNEASRAFVNDPPQSWMPLGEHSSQERGPDPRTLQGLAIGTTSVSRSNNGTRDMGTRGFGNSEISNSADIGLSPDTTHSGSNRPTPNSTTPSETRSSIQAGSNSRGTSYGTSPASSHHTQATLDGRSMSSFFATQSDYSGISSTGLAPENTFTMPDTPGTDFQVPNGWEMSQQTTGLTPVGEGVFRQLMGLGPMDPMDLGWEGES